MSSVTIDVGDCVRLTKRAHPMWRGKTAEVRHVDCYASQEGEVVQYLLAVNFGAGIYMLTVTDPQWMEVVRRGESES
jgi:hypothetical protein